MTKYSHVYLIFIVLWLMQSQAFAQEKILHIFVTDTNKVAVNGIKITCMQRGCSTELVNQGRAKIALPAQTRPNEIITLRLVSRSLNNPEWIIISPPNGDVMVPPFSNQGVVSIPVIVAMKGNKQTLNNNTAIRTIVENALKKAQRLDGQLSEQEFDLALKMQAKAFGVTPEAVIEAIQAWKARTKDPYDQGLLALLDKNYAEATRLLTISYEKRKEGFIDSAYFLGESLWHEGKYNESVEKLREVALFRKDDAVVLNQLGLSLSYADKYSEAETVYRQALAIHEKEYGKGSVQAAIVLNNLALACRLQNKSEEAERLYNEALAINRKELGNEHPLTANSLNNLAQFFRALNKYDKAEPLYKEALAIREKKLGKDHPDTAITMDNLGVLYNLQSRYDEAELLLKYALNVKEKTLGYEHPITANSYGNLGSLYTNQGKYSEAIPFLEKALAIREKIGGDKYSITDDLNNIGIAYHRQGKYSEAEPRYKRALNICERTKPDGCAIIFRNLGKLYTAQGKYAEAEPLFQRALAIYEKGSDEPFFRVVFTLESYAELLRKTNREKEAEAFEALAKEIRDKAKFYGKN